MKKTTIRGVTLRPGSPTYHIANAHESYAGPAVLHDGEEPFPDLHLPRIETHYIAATNGESFAFSRRGINKDAGPWHWVDNPEAYLVSMDEAREALQAEKAAIIVRARESAADAYKRAQDLIAYADEIEAKIPAFARRHNVTAEDVK